MFLQVKFQLNIDKLNVFFVNNQYFIKFKKLYNICYYA